MALPPPNRPPVARVGRGPLVMGRERSGPPERKSLAPRSATITVMIRAAFAAAKALKRDFGEVEQLQVSEKGPGDFVSRADIMAERTLRKELERTRPEYGFLGEEGGEIKGDGRNRWIADPLDGTHQLPARRAALRDLDRARARRRGDRRRRSTSRSPTSCSGPRRATAPSSTRPTPARAACACRAARIRRAPWSAPASRISARATMRSITRSSRR
jgi:hypothetical protein